MTMPVARRASRTVDLASRTGRTGLAVFAVLAVALGATALASPVDARDRSVDDEVVIRLRESVTPEIWARMADDHRLDTIRSSRDGRTYVVDAAGRALSTIRRSLSDDRRVSAVDANSMRELAAEPPAAHPDQWALRDGDGGIGFGPAIARGPGDPEVVVAIIDDGVDFDHPALRASRWTNPGEAGDRADNGIDDDGNGYIDDVHGWDFCNDDPSVHDLGRDGHGTHIASTIAESSDGAGPLGVAPGVRIMALKFIEAGGDCGRDDMAAAAIDYAASFGVPIINISWGGSHRSSVIDAAIGGSGALVVAAAGNGGIDLDSVDGQAAERFYPASSTLPNLLAVAATDRRGQVVAFSNVGAVSVDVAAPGTDILGAYPASSACPDPCLAWSGGTSVAAAFVSGVAALVDSRYPALIDHPISLRSRLLATARPAPSTAGLTSSGRTIDADRATDPAR
jgi:subtilisin family serine protease